MLIPPFFNPRPVKSLLLPNSLLEAFREIDITPGYPIMSHSHALRFRILSPFFTTHHRIPRRTPPSSQNAKYRNLMSTPKHHHPNISENSTMQDLCNVDVLIIGAGPAGLMMASSLVRSGVSFRIIERRYVYDKLTLPHSWSSILFSRI